jgi:hypothetical protein
MDSANYRIPEAKLDQVKAEIGKLNKRAAKLGVALIELAVGEHQDVPYFRYSGKLVEVTQSNKDAAVGRELEYIRFYRVVLTGVTPKLAGWRFVATLEHLQGDDGGSLNLLRTLPWFEGQLPEQYRTASPENCDHCQKLIRTRKETFILQHEDGTWKQVGRQCIKDFLGGADPHAIVKALELLQGAMDIFSGAEDELGGLSWGSGDSRVNLESFLAYVTACIRVDGWTSRGKARESDGALTATADDAMGLMNPPSPKPEKWQRWADERRPTDEDRETVTKALEYVREHFQHENINGRALNDYEFNLHVISKQTLLTWKMSGIAASLISYYLREVERRVLREAELRRVADSKHIGNPGDKVMLNVQVAKVMVVGEMNRFGPSHMHKMITDTGDLVIWFASESAERLKPGQVCTIGATVKNHGEYKGTKQTVVTRVVAMTPEAVELWKAKEAKKAIPKTPEQLERAARMKATREKNRATKEALMSRVVDACADCTNKTGYPYYGGPKNLDQKYNFHLENHVPAAGADIGKVEA